MREGRSSRWSPASCPRARVTVALRQISLGRVGLRPVAVREPGVGAASALGCSLHPRGWFRVDARVLGEDGLLPAPAGMVIAPDIEGRPTRYVADKAWFDELFPVDLCIPVPESPANSPASAGSMADAGAVATTHGEAAADPRDQLAALRRELPARVELVEGSCLKAVDAAHTLMTDFEEAQGLRVQLEEEPLPAEQRIEWMEKLAKVQAAAQASVTTLEQVETLILKV